MWQQLEHTGGLLSGESIEMHRQIERRKEFSQALLSSRLVRGSRGLLCGNGRVYNIWRRGTSEAGGLWTRCSSAVSMYSVGSSIEEEVSLCGHINSGLKKESNNNNNDNSTTSGPVLWCKKCGYEDLLNCHGHKACWFLWRCVAMATKNESTKKDVFQITKWKPKDNLKNAKVSQKYLPL